MALSKEPSSLLGQEPRLSRQGSLVAALSARQLRFSSFYTTNTNSKLSHTVFISHLLRSFWHNGCIPARNGAARSLSNEDSSHRLHAKTGSINKGPRGQHRVLKQRAGVLSQERRNYSFAQDYEASSSSDRASFIAKNDIEDTSDEEEEDDEEEEGGEEEEDDDEGGEDIAYDMLDLEEDELPAEDEDDEGVDNQTDNTKDRLDIWKRVQELLTRKLSDLEIPVTVEDLASLYSFRIDKFQRLAIEGFLKGSSVVVCAPTSSGKTLIAECAAVACLAMRRRLFYTTPLKALSNQKLREFREMFGEENVGLVTGDAAVNTDASILIMTTEILRNMLYQSVGIQEDGSRLQNVVAVVLDEVHYLSDISRGTVWEETVIYCPKEIQLICLSATVANSDELAGWIAQVHGPTELITSRRRPVPLTWYFSTRYSLSPLLNEEGTKMNRDLSLTGHLEDDVGSDTRVKYKLAHFQKNQVLAQKKSGKKGRQHRRDNWGQPLPLSNEELQFLRRRQVPRMEETLSQLRYRRMLPAIWFIFSRKGCDTALKYVEGVQLLCNEEQRQVNEALINLRKECADAVRESAIPSLLCGFASHHAGCLPLWKSFVEDLFQKGLIKVVFATETLAAGINMPARTTILASLSKRGDAGHSLLSSNAMLQMAGRAGRRGLDKHGHVVLMQTPFEGAETACRLLFAGPDALVSQFTASYGMVLNLLASVKSPEGKILRRGKTLEEARALIEQSFGNYVGNDVKVEAMQQVSKLEEKINKLQQEDILDVRNKLTTEQIDEYMKLKERLKDEKKMLKILRTKAQQRRMEVVQPILAEMLKDCLPFIFIRFNDTHSGKETHVSAVCIGTLEDPSCVLQENAESTQISDDEMTEALLESESNTSSDNVKSESLSGALYVALGLDNYWYAFSAASVQKVFKTGLPLSSVGSEEVDVNNILLRKLQNKMGSWQMVGKSGTSSFDGVWSSPSSMDTWCWATNMPPLDSAMEQLQLPEVEEMEHALFEKRKIILKLKKQMKATKASKEFLQALALDKLRRAKVTHLQKKRSQILTRISQMQPSGWPEFLQVVNVLEEVGAIMHGTHEMLPLGEIAAAFRGVNELWLALAFSNTVIFYLSPAQLAAVCASLVSEGIKFRSDTIVSDIYKPSNEVQQSIGVLRETQQWLLAIQNKHQVSIPCELDDQLAGLVEAWASGVSWKELIEECSMDEGDLARLLRRSIDLLVQLESLPNTNTSLHKTARQAADVMDRSPISELIA